MTEAELIDYLRKDNEWLRRQAEWLIQQMSAKDDQIRALKAQQETRQPRATPLTGAERTRRYRQRKKHQQGL